MRSAEEAAVNIPLDTDFDLSDDNLAESLKKILIRVVSELMSVGFNPVFLQTRRLGNVVEVIALSNDEQKYESVHHFCQPCRILDCNAHMSRA